MNDVFFAVVFAVAVASGAGAFWAFADAWGQR